MGPDSLLWLRCIEWKRTKHAPFLLRQPRRVSKVMKMGNKCRRLNTSDADQAEEMVESRSQSPPRKFNDCMWCPRTFVESACEETQHREALRSIYQHRQAFGGYPIPTHREKDHRYTAFIWRGGGVSRSRVYFMSTAATRSSPCPPYISNTKVASASHKEDEQESNTGSSVRTRQRARQFSAI